MSASAGDASSVSSVVTAVAKLRKLRKFTVLRVRVRASGEYTDDGCEEACWGVGILTVEHRKGAVGKGRFGQFANAAPQPVADISSFAGLAGGARLKGAKWRR